MACKRLEGHDTYASIGGLPTLAEYEQLEQQKTEGSIPYQCRASYRRFLDACRVDSKTIFYDAFFGRGITCNPGAIFRYLLRDERFSDFTHIWSIEDEPWADQVMQEYAQNPHVEFVIKDSDDYWRALATAKYLIINQSIAFYYTKREGQVIIATWHGIPLKALGYDVRNEAAIRGAITARSFLAADYIVSPVPYTTSNFLTAFKLDGLYEGGIIEAGYPRVDATLGADRDAVICELRRYGVEIDPKKKVILYAPTWRGEFTDPLLSTQSYDAFLSSLSSRIDVDEYQILFKPHQVVYKHMVKHGMAKENYIPAFVDTNALLGITDILVSDYSSIFFDFLATRRPIIFYITDLDSYGDKRGLYFMPDKLPGPICETVDKIGEIICDIDNVGSYYDVSLYDECVAQFAVNEDGHACERLVDAVFFGDERNVIRLENSKHKLLIHVDNVLRNGICSSARSLMRHIDYDVYDVTFYAPGERSLFSYYCETLPKAVRVLYSNMIPIETPELRARRRWCLDQAITEADNDPRFPLKTYQMEYKRRFGDAKFDTIIDFSGYNAFYANLYHTQKDTRKIIWMHNVVSHEYERLRDGQYVFKRDYDNLFNYYNDFDALVSCSRTTMEENRADLHGIADSDKFYYIPNMIDIEGIQVGEKACSTVNIGGLSYLAEVSADGKVVAVPKPNSDEINFVTVGRLADAKNHVALINAFKKFSTVYPKSRLYIIGDGPLNKRLRRHIDKRKMRGKVVLTGNLENPVSIMKHCSCFVLPSLYEGQPMVLIEARALRLPIIVSNFATVADSSLPNGQLVIGMKAEDIYQGLCAYAEGKVPSDYEFDAVGYNADCMDLFTSIVAGR